MNLTILTGNIATDIELKPAGQSQVVKFNLAVKNPFKKDDTDFIAVEFWNKQAELLQQYCSKGSKIGVEGTLKVDQFQDKEGNNRKATKVNGNRVEFLDSKGSNQSQGTNPNPQSGQTNGTQSAQKTPEENPFANQHGPVDISDEQLPF